MLEDNPKAIRLSTCVGSFHIATQTGYSLWGLWSLETSGAGRHKRQEAQSLSTYGFQKEINNLQTQDNPKAEAPTRTTTLYTTITLKANHQWGICVI